MSWLSDLVNTYAAARVIFVKNSEPVKDTEKPDWSYESYFPGAEKPWSSRQIWGPLESAQDITVLAIQKPGTPILSEIKPHHVFQSQLGQQFLIVYCHFSAKFIIFTFHFKIFT
jgi:hypothetical protein